MKLTYPLTPVHVNQPFGGNASYYAKFLDANGKPEKGHMGVDFMARHGQPVYAAHDGFAFYVGSDSHGGDGIYLRFEDEDNPVHWYTAIYWHLCALDDPQYAPQVGRIGKYVKTGDLLGFADNTGAPFESSGDHLHFGLAPTDQNGLFLEPGNGYGGCIDPMPFFTTASDTPPEGKNLPVEAVSTPTPSPTAPLSPGDRIRVLAARAIAAGNTRIGFILYNVAKLVDAFSTTPPSTPSAA